MLLWRLLLVALGRVLALRLLGVALGWVLAWLLLLLRVALGWVLTLRWVSRLLLGVSWLLSVLLLGWILRSLVSLLVHLSLKGVHSGGQLSILSLKLFHLSFQGLVRRTELLLLGWVLLRWLLLRWWLNWDGLGLHNDLRLHGLRLHHNLGLLNDNGGLRLHNNSRLSGGSQHNSCLVFMEH